MEINTTLDYWTLERQGEVYIARDYHGLAGDPSATIEEAFATLERRLDERQDAMRRMVLSKVKRSEKVYHTRRVGHYRFSRN